MVFQMPLECFLLSPTNDEALRPDVELCWLHRCWSWLWGIWPFCWDKATVAWQHLEMQISILGRLAEGLKWSPILLKSVWSTYYFIVFLHSHDLVHLFYAFSDVAGQGSCLLNTTLKVFSVGPGPRWWPGWKSFRPTDGQIPWGVSQNYGNPPRNPYNFMALMFA